MKKLIIFLLLFLLSACATSPTGRSQLMLVSPEQAIVASKKAYLQALGPFQKEGRLDNNPATSARVKRITGRLIAQAIMLFPKTRNWEWSVKVIDDPEMVNAWCMAGGRMAIYTGLINKLNATDDEIAQVMGHEISHALANHTAEQMSVALASQLGVMGITLATHSNKNNAAISAGSSLAATLAINLPNSRRAEAEADQMGIELAARAGYDPKAAITLWEKMAKEGGNRPPQFLSTHPSPGNRQATLTRLADRVMVYYQDKSPRPVFKL